MTNKFWRQHGGFIINFDVYPSGFCRYRICQFKHGARAPPCWIAFTHFFVVCVLTKFVFSFLSLLWVQQIKVAYTSANRRGWAYPSGIKLLFCNLFYAHNGASVGLGLNLGSRRSRRSSGSRSASRSSFSAPLLLNAVVSLLVDLDGSASRSYLRARWRRDCSVSGGFGVGSGGVNRWCDCRRRASRWCFFSQLLCYCGTHFGLCIFALSGAYYVAKFFRRQRDPFAAYFSPQHRGRPCFPRRVVRVNERRSHTGVYRRGFSARCNRLTVLVDYGATVRPTGYCVIRTCRYVYFAFNLLVCSSGRSFLFFLVLLEALSKQVIFVYWSAGTLFVFTVRKDIGCLLAGVHRRRFFSLKINIQSNYIAVGLLRQDNAPFYCTIGSYDRGV